MIIDMLIKGIREKDNPTVVGLDTSFDYLPEEMREEALHRYEQFVDRFIRENADGSISMTDCCAVAGLGGKQRRSGTFEYYISEPVIENDCKGVGPFIWASLEYDRAKGRL